LFICQLEDLDLTLALDDFLAISKHYLRTGLQCFEAKTKKQISRFFNNLRTFMNSFSLYAGCSPEGFYFENNIERF